MSVPFPAGWVISGGGLGLNKNRKRGKKEGERKLKEQDGVLHAHALLVWGKCSRRLSELHTGFTNFSFFCYF